jgi:hypothetical protein
VATRNFLFIFFFSLSNWLCSWAFILRFVEYIILLIGKYLYTNYKLKSRELFDRLVDHWNWKWLTFGTILLEMFFLSFFPSGIGRVLIEGFVNEPQYNKWWNLTKKFAYFVRLSLIMGEEISGNDRLTKLKDRVLEGFRNSEWKSDVWTKQWKEKESNNFQYLVDFIPPFWISGC